MFDEFLFSLVTGLVLAILGGISFWFDKSENKKGRLQSLYYSLFVFVLFFALTYIFQGIRGVSADVESISKVFNSAADDEIEALFVDLYEHHHREFRKNEQLRAWSIDALRQLVHEFDTGEIWMNPGRAVLSMGSTLFASAKEYVFATNIGEVEDFLENDLYVVENVKAWSERNVLVFRFYLWSERTNTDSFDVFKKKIGGDEGLHVKLKTTYSAVIDLDLAGILPRDLLLIDDTIVGEMECSASGEHLRGVASTQANRLTTVRDYFRQLLKQSQSDKAEHFGMTKQEIIDKISLPRHILAERGEEPNGEFARGVMVEYMGKLGK